MRTVSTVPYDLLQDPNLTHPQPAPIQTKEEELLALLAGSENGRQALIDGLWARIPSYLYEHSYQPSGTQVIVAAQTRNLELITAILAIIPSGSTGTIQLGPLTIPVVSGLFNPTGLTIMLSGSDVRSLTISPAGSLGLYLFGNQLPLYGKMR